MQLAAQQMGFGHLAKSRSHPDTPPVEKLQHVSPSSPLVCPQEQSGLLSWGSSHRYTEDVETPFVVGNSTQRSDVRARRDWEVPACLLVT